MSDSIVQLIPTKLVRFKKGHPHAGEKTRINKDDFDSSIHEEIPAPTVTPSSTRPTLASNGGTGDA